MNVFFLHFIVAELSRLCLGIFLNARHQRSGTLSKKKKKKVITD